MIYRRDDDRRHDVNVEWNWVNFCITFIQLFNAVFVPDDFIVIIGEDARGVEPWVGKISKLWCASHTILAVLIMLSDCIHFTFLFFFYDRAAGHLIRCPIMLWSIPLNIM